MIYEKKPRTSKKKLLNSEQENFCQLYVSPDTEFYGNGVQSYLEAYDKEISRRGNWYNTAKANAYRLLTKPEICKRINELLETGGFNDENVDKQHLFLLNQHADLKTKLGAIKEFNELKGRIKHKIEHSGEIKFELDDETKSKLRSVIGRFSNKTGNQ